MSTLLKRFVIIASFCLSAVFCYADTVATQSMPSVVTAVTAEKLSESLKPQAIASVATASQGYRAKAMDKLRGLWMAYKATSTKELGRAALGYAGSALQYGYKGFKFAIGIPYEINAFLYSFALPEPFVALLLYPLFTGLCPSLSLFSEAFKLLGFSAESIYLLYQGLSTAYWQLGFVEYFYELMTSLWSNYSHVEWAKLPGKVIGSVVYAALILIFGMSVIGNVKGVWLLRNAFYVQLADMFGFYARSAPKAAVTPNMCSDALKFFKSSLDRLKNTNIKIDTVSDQGAIKKAYKFLSLMFHPDKGGAPEDFMKLQGAFESLKSAACLKAA